MPHATIHQLADVLLGQAEAAVAGSVTDHLAAGCCRCGRLAGTLVQLRRVGRFDADHQPSYGAMRSVKALGGLSPSDRRSPLRLRLSFDSLLCPAAAATRTGGSCDRHLVFYSQDLALDLRMECEHGAREVLVTGQLLNRDTGPLPNVPVYLISAADEIVSRSTTGSLGEFHLECQAAPGLQLRLVISDDELVEVELDRREQRGLPYLATARASARPWEIRS